MLFVSTIALSRQLSKTRFFTLACTTATNQKYSYWKRPYRTNITMTSKRTDEQLVNDVLTHWYGSTQVSKYDDLQQQFPLWYSGTQQVDQDIRDRFGNDVELALNGHWDHLLDNPKYPLVSHLTLVIMLDQYTRNIYRSTSNAFSGDEKALEITSRIVLKPKWNQAKQELAWVQMGTLLMPLMHQEDIHQLNILVEKVEELLSDVKQQGEEAKPMVVAFEKLLNYSHKHRDIIAKYGRYPYRNQVLGRTSTPEELDFLEHGPRFGQ